MKCLDEKIVHCNPIVLRRKTWHGRAFIRCYYAISPTIVKWFGKAKWFNHFWKTRLDRLVLKLKSKGGY